MEQSSEELPQDDSSKSKDKKSRRLVCDLVFDFAKNSTLHGLRYFTEGLSSLEKIFWAIILVISVVLCVWAMSNTWVKWQTSPIIISVDDQLMSASEVPFPAVTICPQVKVDQIKFNYTESWITFWKNYNRIKKEMGTSASEKEERMQRFMDETRYMHQLVDVNVICNELINGNAYFAQYTRADTLVQHIKKAAPVAKDIVFGNKWRNSYFDNTDKANISPVLTQEGMCFTFNGLTAEEIFHIDRIHSNYSYLDATAPSKGWSLENGYFISTDDVYPRRGQASGYKEDLMLLLREYSYRRDLLCDYIDQGYKVYLHHPADVPQTSLDHYLVQPEERVSFAIKINVVTTSDSLIKYPPHSRQCYFPSEKSLRYFRAYTPSNCRLECLTNYTFERCKCVFFHMPHNNSALCVSLHQRLCFFEALSEYSAAEDGFGNECQCFPSCYSVQYEADVTKHNFDATPFDRVRQYAVNEVYNKTKPYTIDDHIKDTDIKLYFKEARFATMRRSELYGPTDFLASCGGLLGLFLGFSFLSFVEFLYFFTLRLGCMVRKQKSPDLAKKPEDVDIEISTVATKY